MITYCENTQKMTLESDPRCRLPFPFLVASLWMFVSLTSSTLNHALIKRVMKDRGTHTYTHTHTSRYIPVEKEREEGSQWGLGFKGEVMNKGGGGEETIVKEEF